MTPKEARDAQSLLLTGKINCSTWFLSLGQTNEAERTLLQAGLHFAAILLNLEQFKWERQVTVSLKLLPLMFRAMELANRSELATRIVLSVRHHYLSKIGQSEHLSSFLNCQYQVRIYHIVLILNWVFNRSIEIWSQLYDSRMDFY